MTYRVLQNWPNQVLRGSCSWLPLSVLLRQPPLGSFPCLLGWVDTPVIDSHGPCTYPVAFYGMFVTVSWQSRVSKSATHSLVAHPAVPPSLLPCDTGLNLETILFKARSTAQVHSTWVFKYFTGLPPTCSVKREARGKQMVSLLLLPLQLEGFF